MYKVPILFLVFNRPEETRKVFDSIRSRKPSRLYIAADGPRENRPEEKERCEQVRSIVRSVDWSCEVKTLFREKNLGCKRAVSEGIDWFFENEEEGIILEDDCLPSDQFFLFCEHMLAEFRNDPKVMHIAGTNFIHERKKIGSEEIYFSRYPQVWGWATWRRAWGKYLRSAEVWKRLLVSPWKGSRSYVIRFWEDRLEKTYSGLIDTWDFQWVYTLNVEGGLAVNPPVNLVENIGFGEGSSHTDAADDPREKFKRNSLPDKIVFPQEIKRNTDFDSYIESEFFSSRLWIGKIFRLIRKMIKF
ncbi:hypothetical protein EHQ12_18795 [Leptospira gomenensis]|uniref:Hemolytic protein HlpA-like protein n=1 Tax=Leptospira gomenensis TaxID=2484974 RepID=A0A5F1YRT9_9LEPT|nr:hypothetical protein [Leptospira gomenensis]TGK30900.1 hypothetical protein EHQ17_14340 [Leptospira gomenensis]TGK32538.1 hypothetical protein EHQ12_18795 [Leptospira gomenensis]TGK45380.1 hypothetical protein EHQ07_10655 [Leptospira gomenensis]TGK60628.1 hypothetical protein EHQ13_11150 [Leptospira gomenensis]